MNAPQPTTQDFQIQVNDIPTIAHIAHLFLYLNLCLVEGNTGPNFDRKLVELNGFRSTLAQFDIHVRRANRLSPITVLEELNKKQFVHMVARANLMHNCVIAGDMLLQMTMQGLKAIKRFGAQTPMADAVPIDPKKLN